MALARPRVDMISSPVAMERRAHRRRVFAAAAAAVALFQVADERAVLGRKRQHRLERQRQLVTRAQPQVGVDVKSPVGNDFARD